MVDPPLTVDNDLKLMEYVHRKLTQLNRIVTTGLSETAIGLRPFLRDQPLAITKDRLNIMEAEIKMEIKRLRSIKSA